MNRTILIYLFAIGACFEASSEEPRKASKPNILFIAVDDLRLQANVYGQTKMVTPGLDQLAAEATVFDRAYCSVPVCGASRASLMSGARPTDDRFINYYSRKDVDHPDVPSIPMWFKQAGYTTISNGKIYHFPDDDRDAWTEPPFLPEVEFDVQQSYVSEEAKQIISANRGTNEQWAIVGPATESANVSDEAYPDGQVAQKAVRDLERLAESGEPFFLAVGFWKPHLPFAAPQKYWDLYDPEDIELAENPFLPKDVPTQGVHNFGELRNMYSDTPKEGPVSDELARRLIHGYYAAVSYADAQIRKLLVALEESGLSDNTIVVLWGDHGYHLGEHGLWCKHANYDLTMNAPLIVRVPWLEGGVKTSAITEFIDIYPTLCELTGLSFPRHLDGRSFVSELENPDHYFKDFAYCRYHSGESIITPSFIYTEWRGKDRSSEGRMLFDHRKDPQENVNVSEDPAYAETVNYMQSCIYETRTLMK